MLTLEEAKEWLRIDYDIDDNIIISLIEASKAEISISTGITPDYIENTEDEHFKNLYLMTQRIIVADLYNERATEDKALTSFLIQLEAMYKLGA